MGDQAVSRQVLGYADTRGGPPPRAVLLDLDGTLYTEAGPIPGAVEALASLRQRGVPLRFVTNTTRRPRADIHQRMLALGLKCDVDEIVTAVRAGVATLQRQGITRVAPFVTRETLVDLDAFDLRGGTSGPPSDVPPQAVLLGDLGCNWTFDLLNEAFRYAMAGAHIIALQRNRYWMAADGLTLDAGAFVAALEYAADRTAAVVGKPEPLFFHAALESLGLAADHSIVMVGDDVHGDVAGAQQAGISGWLVQTGKYRPDVLAKSGVTPDRVLTSVAELA